jgi:hypothetical protein
MRREENMKVCNVCKSVDLPWLSTKTIGGRQFDLCNEHIAEWNDYLEHDEEWMKYNTELKELDKKREAIRKKMYEREDEIGKFWTYKIPENH